MSYARLYIYRFNHLTRITFVLSSALFLICACEAPAPSVVATPTPTVTLQTLWDGTLIVEPRQAQWVKVNIDTTGRQNLRILGDFTAQGGSGNDIELLIVDERDFVNWQNSQEEAIQPLYRSGEVTTRDFETPLSESGTYYIIFDNQFSLVSNKVVEAIFTLQYTMP